MSATASDASWDTGIMMPNEEYVLTVTDGMKQTFQNSVGELLGGLGDSTEISAVGVIDYLNPADVLTNRETGESFDFKSRYATEGCVDGACESY